jgi:hypothetical protein
MHIAPMDLPYHASFIFASNRKKPVLIPSADRRYNVANYQADKIPPPDTTAVKSELTAFAEYLLAHKADLSLASTIIDTEARRDIQDLSVTSPEKTAGDILQGNFEELWSAQMEDNLIAHYTTTNEQLIFAQAYNKYMKECAQAILNGELTTKITREELMVVMRYLIGHGVPNSVNKFTSFLRVNGIHIKPLRKNGKLCRGIEITWKVSAELRAELLKHLKESKPLIRKVKG